MKRIFENILTFIIMTFIILIIALVVYIGLDIGGIIEVPDRYSVVKLLNIDGKIIEVTNTINQEREKKESEKVFANTVSSEPLNEDYINKVQDGFASIDQSEEIQEIPSILAHNKFYYSQLDQYGKKIYDKLMDNTENMKDGLFSVVFKNDFDDLLHTENGSEVLDNAYKHGVCAYFLENPDLFYLNINKLCITTKKTIIPLFTNYEVSIGAEEGAYLQQGYIDKVQINNTKSTLDSIKAQIVDACKDKTDYEKIKIVHDYLVDTIEYQEDGVSNRYNIYGALIDRKAVCEWYAVDVTWDDPILRRGTMTNEIKYSYFLKGSDEFFKDHIESYQIAEGTNFKYPELSKTDY